MANVGTVDRALRLIVGLILLLSPFLPPFAGFFATWGAWKFVIAAWGAVMIGTAYFRFCPAYRLIGIRTCPLDQA